MGACDVGYRARTRSAQLHLGHPAGRPDRILCRRGPQHVAVVEGVLFWCRGSGRVAHGRQVARRALDPSLGSARIRLLCLDHHRTAGHRGHVDDLCRLPHGARLRRSDCRSVRRRGDSGDAGVHGAEQRQRPRRSLDTAARGGGLRGAEVADRHGFRPNRLRRRLGGFSVSSQDDPGVAAVAGDRADLSDRRGTHPGTPGPEHPVDAGVFGCGVAELDARGVLGACSTPPLVRRKPQQLRLRAGVCL